jgi:hypothetical protein
MNDRIEIAPDTPQWQAWREYRVRRGLAVELMDRCAALGRPWREDCEWPDETSKGMVVSADEAASQAAEAMVPSEGARPQREPPPFTWCNSIEKNRLIDYLIGTGLTAELATTELMEMSVNDLQRLTLLAMRQQRQALHGNFTASYNPFENL